MKMNPSLQSDEDAPHQPKDNEHSMSCSESLDRSDDSPLTVSWQRLMLMYEKKALVEPSAFSAWN